MAMRSSSESWSGAGADVIDLDRFMRGVRPPRNQRHDRNHLVVDNGGLTRKPPPSSSSSGSSTPRVADPGRIANLGRTPDPGRTTHNKRFSHDSGVSDGSYVRRRHRPHRRYSVAENAGIKTKRDVGPSGSSGSMRAFRAACERTLRDQQRQLERVALLCERIGERRERSERSERTERSSKTDSSDLSSSSRSTRDPRRKDKNRAQECKTYKIIMSKLDELNRVFVSRRPPPARRAPSPALALADKLVATDENGQRAEKLVAPSLKARLVERGVGESPADRESTRSRLNSLRAVSNACRLDIAPRAPVRKYHNIVTESVVEYDSSKAGSRTTLREERCAFNLDDPVQLYAQAKRLQALYVTSARHTSERSERIEQTTRAGVAGGGAGKAAGGGVWGAGGASLCSLCRGYWRLVRGYLTSQVCPSDDLPCACS